MMLMARRPGRPKGTPNKPTAPSRELTAPARRLLALRHQHGMTQPQMAALLGVHTQTVSRWETGAINCPPRVVRMAEILLRDQKKKR
jgi:DNA-binding transcriptional regulator YiaG